MPGLNVVEIADCTVEADESGGYRIIAVDYDGVIYTYFKIFTDQKFERAEELAENTQQRGFISLSNWKTAEELVS